MCICRKQENAQLKFTLIMLKEQVMFRKIAKLFQVRNCLGTAFKKYFDK